MKKTTEYGCPACGKKPKSIPYGGIRTKFWCGKCDCGHALEVNKKRERQKAKKEIKEQKDEM